MKRVAMRVASPLEPMQVLPEQLQQGWKKHKKHDQYEQEPGQVEVRWVNLKRNRVGPGLDFDACEEEASASSVAPRKPAKPTSQAPALSPVRLSPSPTPQDRIFGAFRCTARRVCPSKSTSHCVNLLRA